MDDKFVPSSALGSTTTMNALPSLRVLLVEDDPGMAILAGDRLAEIGLCSVTTSSSAKDCREQVAMQAFDLVLLDRGLPDGNGADLIGELLQLRPELAIVMLTG